MPAFRFRELFDHRFKPFMHFLRIYRIYCCKLTSKYNFVKTFFRLRYTFSIIRTRFFVEGRTYSPSNRNIVRHFPRCFPSPTQLLQGMWRPLSRIHSPRFDLIRTLACVCQITRDPTSRLSSIALNFDLADRSSRCSSCLLGLSVTEGAIKAVSSIWRLSVRILFIYFSFSNSLHLAYVFTLYKIIITFGPIFLNFVFFTLSIISR